LFLPPLARAQIASIIGTVKDSTGAVVPRSSKNAPMLCVRSFGSCFAHKTTSAQEIARDLYDSLSQYLAILKINLGLMVDSK
jgi:hypothetical protein